MFDPEMQLWLIEQDRRRFLADARHVRALRRTARPVALAPRRVVGRLLVRAGLWLIASTPGDARSAA